MSISDDNNFDYESYDKVLAQVLEQATKEYWVQIVDINRHQITVAKTYLWVSAALLGAYFTGTSALAANRLLPSYPCGYIFLIAAVACSVFAFGFCLYSLPGRKGYKLATTSWQNYTSKAYKLLEMQSQSIFRSCLTEMIEDFDSAIGHGIETNATRAKRLRITSWVLVASFISSCVWVLFVLISVITHNGAI